MNKTCIIIPCYNEENRLPQDEFLNYIKNNLDINFCFVNDGSSDQTLQILQSMKLVYPENIVVLDLKTNQGKAEAVRSGINHVILAYNYEIVGYFDADLATPLIEIKRLLCLLNENNYSMAFGSRIKLLNYIIERSNFRHYIGRFFATLSSMCLKAAIYDTQCGSKIFKRELASELFKTPFVTKWLFDVELFARIVNSKGYDFLKTNVVESPLRVWIEKGDSKVKFSNGLLIPLQLLKIKRKYSL